MYSNAIVLPHGCTENDGWTPVVAVMVSKHCRGKFGLFCTVIDDDDMHRLPTLYEFIKNVPNWDGPMYTNTLLIGGEWSDIIFVKVDGIDDIGPSMSLQSFHGQRDRMDPLSSSLIQEVISLSQDGRDFTSSKNDTDSGTREFLEQTASDPHYMLRERDDLLAHAHFHPQGWMNGVFDDEKPRMSQYEIDPHHGYNFDDPGIPFWTERGSGSIDDS